ncbi:MAG: type II secretion system F family protein [Ruaniaceae bacterium]|nr:type II secretion system F family protein [Ruaniaceae bacterium]
MGVVVGLILGAGLLLIWLSFFPRAARVRRVRANPLGDLLAQAGWYGVGVRGYLALTIGIVVVVWIVLWVLTGALIIPTAFALIAGGLPYALVRSRAASRRLALRELWPDALDDLLSSVRAGMSLPEALSGLSERGPHNLREPFRAFALDYQVSARFDDSLDRLKDRLADPVADRIAEALRLTRDVGGRDLGVTLRTLAAMLRDEQRTRGELAARQSWTINAARLAVVAPWLVLAMISLRSEAAQAFNTPVGTVVLLAGASACACAYWLMLRLGALPHERRVWR